MGLCQNNERKVGGGDGRASSANKPRKSVYNNPGLKQAIIYEINQLRTLHQVPELKESSDIDSIAQAFSNKLSKKGELDYSNNNYKGEELGEILFYYSGDCTADTVIESWNKDSEDFKYNNNDPEASSFAQLIWKSSRLIGLGLSKDAKDGTYIVANFFPAGNVVGKFDKNVFPAKGQGNKTDDKSKKKKKGNADNSGLNEINAEGLEWHNKYRAKHHSPPLTINNDLVKIAQAYANKLASNNKFEHSHGKMKGEDLGENLFMCQGKAATGEMATNEWYNEIKKFSFKKEYQRGTGHFTQLIWKGTSEVGFGIANKGDTYYVVANYYPAGNILGKFSTNVLKA